MSQSFELTGKVKAVLAVQNYQNGQKEMQEIVVEELSDKYPNSAAIKFFDKNYEKLKALNVKPNDVVKVVFSIKVNEWNGKYFSNLSGFGIDMVNKVNNGASSQTSAPSPQAAPPAQQEESDELPF